MCNRVVALVIFASGCGEHWYAWDEVEVPFTGPGRVTVQVTTTPEAWPNRLYDHAVRARFDAGEILLVEEGRSILQDDPSWVNVLDAWDGCDPDTVCVERFEFDVSCGASCAGTLLVDAFLATHPLPEPDRGGSVSLEILLPDDGQQIGW